MKERFTINTVRVDVELRDGNFLISIPGTNELADMWINLDLLPDAEGMHRGANKIAKLISEYIITKYSDELCIYPIRLKGHSMGGAIAECLAINLNKIAIVLSLRLLGSFGVSLERYEHSYEIIRERVGNDLIPVCMPWYYNETTRHLPSKSKFPFTPAKDHNSYSQSPYT